jgi:hypothetical protein
VTWEAKDWTARLVQHEFDHVRGKLFTDIMENTSLRFDYWDVVNHGQGDFRLKYGGVKNGFWEKLVPSRVLHKKI